jgi:Peptidase family M28
MAITGNRGLMLALIGVALLLATTLIAYRPPAPLGPDASPAVFSAFRAKAILQELVGSGVPHPIGSAAGAQLREAIVERLRALGYAPELQSGFVCSDEGVCGSPVNIIAKLGGSSQDSDAVLLAAHYDSVPAGPGASDDGAAVASMLEIARILAARPPPRHPIILLLTDGEEAGLLGALLFVDRHPIAKQVKAAVNLEARGTSGPSLMFETGAANSWLMRLYGSAIARPLTNSLYYVVYKLLPNDTDFTVFKAAGYQGFNFAFIGNVGRYHTPLDNVANADDGSIQHQGDNALAALGALANSATLWAPAAESVFFDVFTRTLIAWPSEFTGAAALLSLALLLAETVVLLRRGAVTGRAIFWGGVGTLCTLLLGVASCAGLLALLIGAGKVPRIDGTSWNSHPWPMHVAAAAFALLCAGGTVAWLARRAGFWGFWIAASLLGAVLAVATAVAAPGASFVFLLTAIAAGLGGLPITASLARARARWASFAALLPALVIFAVVLPLLRFLYMALGSLAWPVSTLVLCLGTITLLPLLAAATATARRRVIATAALAALGGALVMPCLPTYSADWPERINLEYWLDADTGESHYLARCDSLRLPAALAAAADFDPVPRPRFVEGASLAFYAAAPQQPLRHALGAPDLRLTAQPTPTSLPGLSAQSALMTSPATQSAPTSRSATHYELSLRSARGAPEAFVVFPASAQVSEAVLTTTGGPVRAKLGKLKSGATILDIVALPAAGVEFSFDAAGRLPLKVQVFDQSYDFPQQRLQRARPSNATSSQDGDLTVVHRTRSLDPAADRADPKPT